ncbi:hypothetical protein ACLMJK_004057 [Lecanora helva]
MSLYSFASIAFVFSIFSIQAFAQSSSSCSTTLTPTNSIKPSVASGYQAALVATGVSNPRGIAFDSSGNLLVIQSGSGIASLQLQDDGGTCVSVKSKKVLLEAKGLNHGLALSQDGKTLYASTPEAAYSWDYDPAQSTLGETNKTIVKGMSTSDHTTRTLLISNKVNGTLLVSRGSTSNIDPEAETLSSGHSQIRAFDLNNVTDSGYDFNTEGTRLGWGLRNSVGVVEHPMTGGIYSVENSVDQATREGKDIHEDNPGEEMNFHGYLNGTEYPPQGSNYGYPFCFAAWAPGDLPMNSNLSVGSQFAIGDQNNTINDTYCAEQTPPRLTFQAHMAPLDIKFNNSGNDAWVAFHGSWDRTNPSGYKVSTVQFANGEPVAPANSNTSYTDIFANADNSACPDKCFRPVSMAFDVHGRMFVSADYSGEIYVVVRDEESNGTASSTSNGSPAGGGKASDARRVSVSVGVLASLLAAVLLAVFQTLDLDFSKIGNIKPWPANFESALNGMPPAALCKKVNELLNPPQPPVTISKRGNHYQQSSGSVNGSDGFRCQGILHPLPPQYGLPGWQRISMMQYTSPSSQNITNNIDLDDCFCFEGVVLPGGKIMVVGRYWETVQDRVRFSHMGPFIYWEIGEEP